MPTYEYRCKGCAREFEIFQSFQDDALTTCDECGGALRKLFGNVGISFKGDGFYKNDHGANASSTKSDASSSSTESSSTKSESSSSSSSDTSPSKGDSSTTKSDSSSSQSASV